MKKGLIFSLLICFAASSIVSAQDKDEKRKESFEKFRAKRVAFITERVKFTTEEAQAFWPICNELQEKKFELTKPLREKRKSLRDSKKEMTDEEYMNLIDLNADIKIKEAELDKEYLQKFKKVLPAEKIFKYYRAEEEFMKQMFSPRDKDSRERRNPGAERPRTRTESPKQADKPTN